MPSRLGLSKEDAILLSDEEDHAPLKPADRASLYEQRVLRRLRYNAGLGSDPSHQTRAVQPGGSAAVTRTSAKHVGRLPFGFLGVQRRPILLGSQGPQMIEQSKKPPLRFHPQIGARPAEANIATSQPEFIDLTDVSPAANRSAFGSAYISDRMPDIRVEKTVITDKIDDIKYGISPHAEVDMLKRTRGETLTPESSVTAGNDESITVERTTIKELGRIFKRSTRPSTPDSSSSNDTRSSRSTSMVPAPISKRIRTSSKHSRPITPDSSRSQPFTTKKLSLTLAEQAIREVELALKAMTEIVQKLPPDQARELLAELFQAQFEAGKLIEFSRLAQESCKIAGERYKVEQKQRKNGIDRENLQQRTGDFTVDWEHRLQNLRQRLVGEVGKSRRGEEDVEEDDDGSDEQQSADSEDE